MNYEDFRVVWHEALREAGLMPVPTPKPIETIKLDGLSRTYKLIIIHPGDSRRTGPFHSGVTLDWEWDPILAARSATREEDLLTEMFGREGYNLNTEPPWLRVSVTLSAGPPYDSPIRMPAANEWRRWAAELTDQLNPLLPFDSRMDEHGLVVLAARSEPEARLRCEAEGRLALTGVELSAWQAIILPRQWDNPDRLPDPTPTDQLVDFASRVNQAFQVWNRALVYLQPPLAV